MILLNTSEVTSRQNVSSNWMRFAWRTSKIAIVVSLAWRQYKLGNSMWNQFDKQMKGLGLAHTTPTYNSNSNSINSSSTTTTNIHQQYLQQELDEWRKIRVPLVEQLVERFINEPKTKPLPDNAEDTIGGGGGPILDFLIAGFPKCGTTGMMRTLHSVAVMPSNSDVCVPMKQTVWKAYVEWPKTFGGGPFEYSAEKPLKGSKCPQWLENNLDEIGRTIPETPIIVGIRHPVLFFQSFGNQLWHNFGSKKAKKSNVTVMDFLGVKRLQSGDSDTYRCPRKQLFCMSRSRFHLSLARLGKTPLQKEERDLLAEELYQARRRRNDTIDTLVKYPIPETVSSGFGVPNKVFLFDSNQGREEYLYQELAGFVGIDREHLPPIKNTYKSRWSGNTTATQDTPHVKDDFAIDICLPEFDILRKELMPIAHTLGRWLLDYFIPASLVREDVTIPNVTAFQEIVEGYLRDPCDDALVRNATDGEYYHRVREKKQART